MSKYTMPTHLDYAVRGNLIVPFMLVHPDDFMPLVQACERGEFVMVNVLRKKRRRAV